MVWRDVLSRLLVHVYFALKSSHAIMYSTCHVLRIVHVLVHACMEIKYLPFCSDGTGNRYPIHSESHTGIGACSMAFSLNLLSLPQTVAVIEYQ